MHRLVEDAEAHWRIGRESEQRARARVPAERPGDGIEVERPETGGVEREAHARLAGTQLELGELGPVSRVLRFVVEARVVERRSRMAGGDGDELLVAVVERPGAIGDEHDGARDVTAARADRHGEHAAGGLGHAAAVVAEAERSDAPEHPVHQRRAGAERAELRAHRAREGDVHGVARRPVDGRALRFGEDGDLVDEALRDALDVEVLADRLVDAHQRLDGLGLVAGDRGRRDEAVAQAARALGSGAHRGRGGGRALAEQLDKARHLGAEHVDIERLVEEVDRAARVALGDGVTRGLVGGEDDDGDGVGAIELLEQGCGLEAVELRHLQIEKDDRKVLVLGDGDRLAPRCSLDEALAERLEDRLERHEVRQMIVHEQDAHGRVRRRDRGTLTAPARRSRFFLGGSCHSAADIIPVAPRRST